MRYCCGFGLAGVRSGDLCVVVFGAGAGYVVGAEEGGWGWEGGG